MGLFDNEQQKQLVMSQQQQLHLMQQQAQASMAIMQGCTDKLGAILNFIQGKAAKTPKRQLLTINESGATFDNEGFKFAVMVATEPAIIHVELYGIKYDLTLSSGPNRVDIPAEAMLSVDEPITVMLILSDEPILESTTQPVSDKPRLIASIGASTLAGNWCGPYHGVFNRAAQARTLFFVNNGLDQAPNNLQLYPVDSAIDDLGLGLKQQTTYDSATAPGAKGYTTWYGYAGNQMGAHCDSLGLHVAFATNPTVGSLDIYLIEYFPH